MKLHLTFLALLAMLALWPGALRGAAPPTLRVCSDPNNLPFSDRAQQGFEDALARLVARELGMEVTHYYWARRRGFLRNTLKADKCDIVMGVPTGADMLATSRPYYRSSYVFVTHAEAPRVRSFDDPRLRALRIGVPLLGDDYTNPPPVHALSRRRITRNVTGYSVFGDYREESPPLELLRALSRGEIDVAIAWGPSAGFFVRHSATPLQLSPVLPQRDGPYPLAFDVSVGVRPDARALLRVVDQTLLRQRRAIQELLREYGVPQL
jgi:mxaJ protein